jgi:hypothetical protein
MTEFAVARRSFGKLTAIALKALAGNTPSPSPKRNRTMSICVKLATAPVSAVKPDHKSMAAEMTLRNPYLSAKSPPGT